MADEDVWDSIDRLHDWLDADRSREGHPHDDRTHVDRAHDGREELLLRILKLSEEVGEVARAVIGATGQNPRKGTTHTWDDVRAELCDVVITGLVALRTLGPDAREVFTAHLAGVTDRSLGTDRGSG
ncbi:MazG-like family protein [Streptomyces sp. NBC_01571]|uniref:MazG-like family protein n=1 Tax=unclassified Streptomyces TaxID=2593676 RepID=UPI00225071CF|nr:MazG-like family protein [Streptomyces sp. NBC_01571]MCX4574646.1 MazG-like family protein [Streptomyces sp. NBC_01571]